MSGLKKPRFGAEDVRIMGTQECFKGHLQVQRLKLQCRLYEGGWSETFFREVLLRYQGVGLLPYDPVLDKVLLVEQFRVGCLSDEQNGPWALELVAGLLDKEESAAEVAVREAEEEAGLQLASASLIPVASYYNSPGGSSEKLNIFCAPFDAGHPEGIYGLAAESENIRSCIMTRLEAIEAIEHGRINNAMSIIALQWLQLNLDRVRQSFSL